MGLDFLRSGSKDLGLMKSLCLMANAKNRVGGYNGFRWTVFYFSMDNQFLAADGNPYATAVCQQLTAVPV